MRCWISLGERTRHLRDDGDSAVLNQVPLLPDHLGPDSVTRYHYARFPVSSLAYRLEVARACSELRHQLFFIFGFQHRVLVEIERRLTESSKVSYPTTLAASSGRCYVHFIALIDRLVNLPFLICAAAHLHHQIRLSRLGRQNTTYMYRVRHGPMVPRPGVDTFNLVPVRLSY